MNASPSVIVFDVNETLSDTAALAARFTEVGAPAHLAPLWFASVLRDGFALAAAGAARPFVDLGADVLRSLLHGVELPGDPEEAVAHVVGAVAGLPLHPDVADGVRALRADGHRLFTLSNGSAGVAERLLAAAGLRSEFEAVLSVEDAGAWKPAAAAYAHALRVCGSDPQDVLLVAVHPWDLDGAARAGLRTAWIDRTGAPYPGSFTPPTWRASGVGDLRDQLAGARGSAG